ncbi:PucR family transcriptional regulator [Paenibacillus sp. GXUN7292]|uniref:PucR family transcriptional regulator n=1 Tax=Paenibacillus sp. GXUN7292 TaxID=3422499 RepID=UPI003D7DC2CB
MSKTEWINALQTILNCSIQVSSCSLEQWQNVQAQSDRTSNKALTTGKPEAGDYAEYENSARFVVAAHDEQLDLIVIPRADLSATEKELISCLIQQACTEQSLNSNEHLSETERAAMQISEWLLKQLASVEPAHSLPDHLVMGSRMYAEMIPLLLVMEQSNTSNELQATYMDLDKLLRSFLADDILLIPLKNKEWLIWGPVSLLRDEEDAYDSDQEESLEESLASIAHGLNEMLVSEWLEDCHLAVAPPISPANSMVETVLLLRETINLGRKFHVGTSIHLPWMLQLERIVNAIPEAQRAKYLEQSLKKGDLFLEAEMLATLEAFFMLDCNVSETAKRLYIHRNTLLYRLDKLKQETGLDVRLFRDAVLVKIILLLYKVTKRN